MTLKNSLGQEGVVVAPGVCDALTALIATQAGFETLYVSGAGVAYTRLGRPDIGLVSMTEMAETVALIRDRVGAALIVDADNGHGNALNVQRTVRLFERAGANALQLEDQSLPKRCGHLAGKSLVGASEMVGKVRAAADARHSEETLLVVRTDAIAVEGFESAVERAHRYVEAGADVLFIEAPRDRSELERIASTFAGRIPLLANMVEGGATPLSSADDLGALGFKIVIFPGGIVRALVHTAEDYYRSLAAHRTNEPFADRMQNFDGLNERLGTPELLRLGESYSGESSPRTGEAA